MPLRVLFFNDFELRNCPSLWPGGGWEGVGWWYVAQPLPHPSPPLARGGNKSEFRNSQSMSLIFHALCHSFICFSRAIAEVISPTSSYQTSIWTWYFFVKPSIIPCLCSWTRLARSFVTPIYKVPFRLLAKMYTVVGFHSLRPVFQRDDTTRVNVCFLETVRSLLAPSPVSD